MMTRIKHLYVHVPFCDSICFYCDFARSIYSQDLAERWLDQLEKEAKGCCRDRYETIYIGGGTPSALPVRQLERLLKIIAPHAGDVEEYTIEANPESLDQEKIGLFVSYGINRVSLGVQTTDERLLKTINRHHSFEDVKDRVSMLKAGGLGNISVDLMYSLPGQDIASLKSSLSDILSLDIPHISIYSLTIEEGSVFGKKGIEALDIETEADMYELIEKTLTAQGYIHYEVSNFARPGKESRHNMGYWNYEDFLGISLSASSKIGNRRYTRTRSMNRYLRDFETNDEDLVLDRKDLMFENIMMSLRTVYGLDIAAFNDRYACDLLAEYEEALKDERLCIRDGHLICRDLETLNDVLLKFME